MCSILFIGLLCFLIAVVQCQNYNEVVTLPGNGTWASPRDIEIDSQGNLFIADSFNNRVVRVTNYGYGTSSNIATGFFCTGLAADGTGNVYATDYYNNKVYVIPNYGSGTAAVYASTSITSPWDVAVDPITAGVLYVSDYVNGRILKVTGAGATATVYASSLTGARGLAIDPNGLLFVAYFNKIRKIDTKGVQTAADVLTLPGALNVADDPFGNIFVSSPTLGRVVKFNVISGVQVDVSPILSCNSDINVASLQAQYACCPTMFPQTVGGTGKCIVSSSCPSYTNRLWGSHPYTSDSDVYLIAKHSGFWPVTASNTPTFLIEYSIVSGAANHPASYQNEFTSTVYAAYPTSAVLLSSKYSNQTAKFCNPHGLAVTSGGDLFVAEIGDRRIRKVSFCGANQSWNNVTNTCVCNAGYGFQGDGTCAQCQPGYYSVSNSTCISCASGYYSNVLGSSSCLACPAGKDSNAAKTDCITCDSGKYRTSSMLICDLCPAGMEVFSNQTGCSTCTYGRIRSLAMANCADCPAGYEAAANKSSCVMCSSGYYKPSTDYPKCIPCPSLGSCSVTAIVACQSGYKINAAMDGCDQCPVGTQSSGNSLSCVNCVSGTTYRNTTTQSSCQSCPSNSACITSGFTCNAGYEINGVSTGCQVCQDGFSKPSSGNAACAACGTGTESAADKLSCIACSAGFYRPSTLFNKCIPCPQNGICTASTLTRCANGIQEKRGWQWL